MSDIVERLRHCSENCGDEYLHELSGRAADEITRLRAEIERQARQLQFWCKAYRSGQHEPLVIAYESTVRDFPAALTEPTHE